MRKDIEISRRKLLKTAALGAAATIAGGALRAPAHAQQATAKVDPADPLAQALHYVEDASKAPADLRTDATHFCHNCQFFQGDPSAQTAPCQILTSKLVPNQGWCMSWVMKGTA